MSKENSDKLNWILAGALILIAIFVFASMVLVNSQALEQSFSQGSSQYSSLSVSNQSPSVSGVTISQMVNGNKTTLGPDRALSLQPGAWTDVVIDFTVSDNASDINNESVLAILATENELAGCLTRYNESVAAGRTNKNAGANWNNCYMADNKAYANTPVACEKGATTETTAQYSCTLEISYTADSTGKSRATPVSGIRFPNDSWRVLVIAEDSAHQKSSTDPYYGNSVQLDANNTLSVSFPSHINYGEVAVAGYSQEFSLNLTNNGNSRATLNVHASDMKCRADQLGTSDDILSFIATGTASTGTVPVAKQKWSLISGEARTIGKGNSLSTTSTDTLANVGWKTAAIGNATTTGGDAQVYFAIQNLPDVAGYCYGSITATAGPRAEDRQ